MRTALLISLAALLAIALTNGVSSMKFGPTPSWAALFGDANCDGNVNALDAALLLQFSAGLITTLPCSDKADVNGDGTLNPLDAALVLQFSAGLLQSIGPVHMPTPTAPPTAASTSTPAPTATFTPTLVPTSTPTPAATSTPVDTPTNTPTATPTPTPIVLSGNGQEATSIFQLMDGLAIFRMKHDGDSNFIIWLLDGTGNPVDLLVNEIGGFNGSTAIGIEEAGSYLLDVNGDGNWNVTIEQPRSVQGLSLPQQIDGQGQDVSPFLALQGGLTRFEMAHDGDSNFIIWLLDDGGSRVDLLVNEIGEFDGSTALGVDAGTYILDITGNGTWKINVSQ